MQTIITSLIAIAFIGLYIYEKYYKKIDKPNKLRGIEDVKEGEWVLVQFPVFQGGMGYMKCITNNPAEKSIMLEISFTNHVQMGVNEKQLCFLPYDSPYLANFKTLNQIKHSGPQPNHNDVEILEKQEKEFIAREEYEKAQLIRKQINEILNKK